MNRLVIVGNGFDLARNLNTSYEDFIYWYLTEQIEKATHGKIDNASVSINYLNDNNINKIHSYYKKTKNVTKHENRLELYTIFARFLVSNEYPKDDLNNIMRIKKDSIIWNTCNDIKEKGWADIEKSYYNKLVFIAKDNLNDAKLDSVKYINKEMNLIRSKLLEYIEEQKESIKSYLSFKKIFEPFNNFDFPLKNKESITNINKSPQRIMVLNFNYTNCFEFETKKGNEIFIHGKIKEPDSVVFGYGDELDDNYKSLEMKGENEWLKYFKSFSYLRNSEYNKLLGFVENGPFQVCIVGHSCGLTDRTLLNYIFEHKDCVSIKPFYYKDSETTDNFDNIVFNISRIMDNKLKLRERVINREYLNEDIKSLLESTTDTFPLFEKKK